MKTLTSKLVYEGFTHEESKHYFHAGNLGLGNNFTYAHFIAAIDIDQLRDACRKVSIEDTVTIIANGKYGKVILRTCASDLFDHVR